MSAVTILHLSDLHAGAPRFSWDAGYVLDPILKDLAKLEKEYHLSPDLILFTGDAAFGNWNKGGGRPMEEQFDRAFQIIDAIRNVFRGPVPLEHCFFVPGNHDVNREKTLDIFDSWIAGLDTVDPINEMLESNQPDLKKKRSLCLDRLDDYRSFLKRHGLGHCGADSDLLIYSHSLSIRGMKVRVAGFNSAFTSGSDHEKGKLRMAARWQASKLLATSDDSHLQICLVHHPDSWMHESDAKLFQLLATKNIDLVFHGHEHEQWIDPPHLSGRPARHVRIAAGPMYEGSEKENGYSIVRWDSDNRATTVYLRGFNTTGGGWVSKPLAGITDDLGRWPPKTAAARVTASPSSMTRPRIARQGLPLKIAVIGPLSSEESPFGLSHARGIVAAVLHALDKACGKTVRELDPSAAEKLSDFFTFEWIDSDQFRDIPQGLRQKFIELQGSPDGQPFVDAIFGPMRSGEAIKVFLEPELRVLVRTILVSAATTLIDKHPDYGLNLLRPAPTLQTAAEHAAIFAYYYHGGAEPCQRVIVLHPDNAFGLDTAESISAQLREKNIFKAIKYTRPEGDGPHDSFTAAMMDSVKGAAEGHDSPLVFLADTGNVLALLAKRIGADPTLTVATVSAVNSALLRGGQLEGLYALGTFCPKGFALNEPNFQYYIGQAQRYLSTLEPFKAATWLEADTVDAEVHDGTTFWLDRDVMEKKRELRPRFFKNLYVTNMRMVRAGADSQLRNATAMTVHRVLNGTLQTVHVSRNKREM